MNFWNVLKVSSKRIESDTLRCGRIPSASDGQVMKAVSTSTIVAWTTIHTAWRMQELEVLAAAVVAVATPLG